MAERYVKIGFSLDRREWHSYPSEALWAEPIGEVPPKAGRLMNSPFYARGVSFMDIVRIVSAEDGFLEYAGIIEKSGHSTIWLLVPADSLSFEEFWSPLHESGCRYEGADHENRILYAVDVPPEADIERVFFHVEDAQRKNVWPFQVGDLAHKWPPH
jgi:uncharacterized protein DUF4265